MKDSVFEYIRIGDFIARVLDGYVDSVYRIDNPMRTYRPKMHLTVTAARMRNSRKKLECILK